MKEKEDYTDGYPHDILWNPKEESLNELMRNLFLGEPSILLLEIKFILKETDNEDNLIYRIILV